MPFVKSTTAERSRATSKAELFDASVVSFGTSRVDAWCGGAELRSPTRPRSGAGEVRGGALLLGTDLLRAGDGGRYWETRLSQSGVYSVDTAEGIPAVVNY